MCKANTHKHEHEHEQSSKFIAALNITKTDVVMENQS